MDGFIILAFGEVLPALLPFVVGVWIITAVFRGPTGFVLGVIFVLFWLFRKKR